MSTNEVEIMIAAATQIGLFLLMFGGMRVELRNLKTMAEKAARHSKKARLIAAELKGQITGAASGGAKVTLNQ